MSHVHEGMCVWNVKCEAVLPYAAQSEPGLQDAKQLVVNGFFLPVQAADRLSAQELAGFGKIVDAMTAQGIV